MQNQEGKTLLKKIILFQIVIFIYILLTSSIVNYRTEDKITDIMVSSVVRWSEIRFGHVTEVTERERQMSMEVDKELSEKFKGKMLLQVESHGEIWYVYPEDNKRYYLGRANDAFRLAKNLGQEILNEELIQYIYFDQEFPEHLLGRILLDSKNNKDMYYVDPETKQAHFFNRPDDTLEIFKEHAMGIVNEKIRMIEVGEIK
ncbi:hypothetical protein ACFLZ9_01005 [Patescibacteria group bacterium]